MIPATDPDAALFDAFWGLVAEHGWRGVTMRRLAAAAGLSPAELRARATCPHELLRRHASAIDRAVLDGTHSWREADREPLKPRDRIFDVLMRRLDALEPHRLGVLRLLEELKRDPLLAVSLLPGLAASMAWMLEACELDTRGPAGALRVNGLLGVWLVLLRAWSTDEGPHFEKTMQALDHALDRAERVAGWLGLAPGDMIGPATAVHSPPM